MLAAVAAAGKRKQRPQVQVLLIPIGNPLSWTISQLLWVPVRMSSTWYWSARAMEFGLFRL